MTDRSKTEPRVAYRDGVDRSAGFAPSSYDPETRTLDVVLSTGADVLRSDFWTGANYVERLEVSPEAVVLDRLNNGAPLLAVHNSRDLGAVLGKFVEGSARVEGGQIRARVRLTGNPEKAGTIGEIVDGTLSRISTGYYVHAERIDKATADAPVEIRTATRWEPFEGSVVPVPADDGAGTRSHDGGAPAPREGQTMSDTTNSIETAPDPVAAERARAAEILSITDRHALPVLGRELVAGGVTVDDARKRVLDELATRDAARPTRPHVSIEVVTSDAETRAEGMTEALLHRGMPSAFALTERGRPYAGRSLIALAERFLTERGVSCDGLNPMQIAERAMQFRSGGNLSSTDFALTLANVATKTLRKGYEQAPSTFEAWCKRASARDFKTKYPTMLGAVSALQPVGEGGEIKRGTIKESREGYAVADYALIVAITRKVLVNDDLGAFVDVPAKLGLAAKRKENAIVYGLLTANAAMADGVAIFHANHKNLATGGDKAAPSVATLGKARKALRQQVGLAGEKLNLSLAYLIAGSEQETAIDQLRTALTPAQASNAVPEYIRRLVPVIEPLLDDTDSGLGWYGVADPALCDGIEYAYLEGENGVTIETRVGWDVDGVEIKAREAFGAGVIDYRGLYKNPGA